jgi:hypothetical protein
MSAKKIHEEIYEESSTTRKSSQLILNKKNSKNTKISSMNSETLVNHKMELQVKLKTLKVNQSKQNQNTWWKFLQIIL